MGTFKTSCIVSVPQADLLELVKFVVASPKAVAWSYGGMPRLVKVSVEAISENERGEDKRGRDK